MQAINTFFFFLLPSSFLSLFHVNEYLSFPHGFHDVRLTRILLEILHKQPVFRGKRKRRREKFVPRGFRVPLCNSIHHV
jgi:hypothetical protein